MYFNVYEGLYVESGVKVFSLEGLGPPKATVSGLGGPNRDGIRVNYVRTDSRHMTLTLVIPPGEDEQSAKEAIYEHFPIKQKVSLVINSDSGQFNIDAYIESVEMNEWAKIENAVISLLATDPWFYATGIVNSLILPAGTTIVNTGDMEAGVELIMYITGSVFGPFSITNEPGYYAGQPIETMNFDVPTTMPGYPLANGDQIIIKTHMGGKSIYHWRGTTGYNLIKELDFDDPWIWVYPGDNDMSYTVTTGVANTQLYIKYYRYFQGV